MEKAQDESQEDREGVNEWERTQGWKDLDNRGYYDSPRV